MFNLSLKSEVVDFVYSTGEEIPVGDSLPLTPDNHCFM